MRKYQNGFNIHIRDAQAVELMTKYCKMNDISCAGFVTMLINGFFEDERIQLSMKSKEELIDVIITNRLSDKES